MDDIAHPRVTEAVRHVVQVAKARGRPLGIFLPDAAQADAFATLGFTFFVMASDQGMLKKQANEMMARFHTWQPDGPH